MELSLLIVATIINVFTIKWKISKGRHKDIFIEVSIIILLTILFGKTITGMSIATSVSAFWSIWTIMFPIKGFKY